MKDKLKRLIKPAAAVAAAAAVLLIAYFSADDFSVSDKTEKKAETIITSQSQTTVSSSLITQTSTTVKSETETTTSSASSASSSVSFNTTRKTAKAQAIKKETSVSSAKPSETTSAQTYTQIQTTPPTQTTTVSMTESETSIITSAETPPVITSADKYSKHCSLMISCHTVFDNSDKIDASILAEQPADGIIFPTAEIGFDNGETVYDVLSRVCREKDIPIEVTKIAATKNYYIEGINNLYEFDAGDLSGWMYSVNGKFPQMSTSQYNLSDGDVVEIVYSCNIGVDVGDDFYYKAG